MGISGVATHRRTELSTIKILREKNEKFIRLTALLMAKAPQK